MSDIQTKVRIVPTVVGASSARSEIASVFQALRDGTMTVKEANSALREYGGSIRAQNRAVALLRAEYRANHATMVESMRTMTRVASIGRTITSTYQTYTLMQTRVADKTRDVRDTQELLADVQVRRQRVVADLGATNAISLRLMNEEARLTKRLSDEKRGLKQAQDQNILGYAGMSLELVGLVPKTIKAYNSLSDMRTLLGTAWKADGLSGIVTAAGLADSSLTGVLTTLGLLTTAVAAPYVATILVKTAMESPYYLGDPDEYPIPPSAGGTPGFDMWGWLTDIWKGFTEGGGFGGADYAGYGEDRIPSDLTGTLMDELAGLGEWAGKTYGESTLPDTSVTVEGDDVDVEVNVTVTPRGRYGGGERRLR